MDLALRGRAALVTGAAGGICRAVAHALAGEGVRVALVDRDRRAVADVAAGLAATGAVAHAVAADVTDPDQVDAAVREAADALGGRARGSRGRSAPRCPRRRPPNGTVFSP